MISDPAGTRSGPRAKTAQDPDDLPPGTVVGGRYRIERRLGGGAIGNVYEATNTWTTRRVALKLLRRDFADDPEIAQRFLIEARAATTVAHPHIVDVLDMGEDADSKHLYLVQEFLEGRDLHEHLKAKHHLTPEGARDVLLPVMHALAAAHEKGVLHRDLKPENVFLVTTPEGDLYPKVIDFGLARTNASALNRVTRVGAVMGTPFYMSPEQARGENNVDARSDVWAMGVLWYESLAGVVPFEGDNLQAVLHQIFMVDPVRLDVKAPHVSREVADAVHHALQRDRNARYPSMADFLDAMIDVLPEAPQAPSTMRSSRPGQGPRSTRPARPTPTPAHGMSRGKLSLGPPRRPTPHHPLPSVEPANEAFAATLHATPAPGQLIARPKSDDFAPYKLGIPPAPSVPDFRPPAPMPEVTRQVRVLRALLGFAIVALVVVAAVALVALRREVRPGVVLTTPVAPRRLPPPPPPVADAAARAATHDAALDAAPAASADAAAGAPEEEDGGARRSRRHRSRRDEDTGERSSHRSRRHRSD